MREAAKDIMYARQRMFEYKDKPGKYLARLLAEVEVNLNGSILNETGQKVACPQQKVEVFV